jgi:hypothetical protein
MMEHFWWVTQSIIVTPDSVAVVQMNEGTREAALMGNDPIRDRHQFEQTNGRALASSRHPRPAGGSFSSRSAPSSG